MDNLYPCFDEMLVLAHNGFLFWNLYRARPPLPNDSNSIVSRNSHTYQITGENCACTSKPCCLRRGVADPVLMRSAMVVVGESGERGLGFPRPRSPLSPTTTMADRISTGSATPRRRQQGLDVQAQFSPVIW